jgi:methionine biosynthesis protein MetW
MLRVATRAIVSFPNLGYKEYREQLDNGRAPQTDPREGKKWYNSSDVRFLTITDFQEFCHEKGYKIFKEVALNSKTDEIVEENINVNGDVFVVVLGR